MAHTRTRATERGALAREGLVYCQPWVIRCPPPNHNYLVSAHKGVTSTTPYFQGSLASLLMQPTTLRDSLCWPNQRGSEMSQAFYDHPSGNLTLSASSASLFCQFSGAFSSSLTHLSKQPSTPFVYCVLCCTNPLGLVRWYSSPP